MALLLSRGGSDDRGAGRGNDSPSPDLDLAVILA